MRVLDGLTILIVEDDYWQANELAAALAHAGARIVGPAATLSAARVLVAAGLRIDVAVLDINLRGAHVFPLAEELQRHAVPVVFATGYDADMVPATLVAIERCEKPLFGDVLLAAVGRAIADRQTDQLRSSGMPIAR